MRSRTTTPCGAGGGVSWPGHGAIIRLGTVTCGRRRCCIAAPGLPHTAEPRERNRGLQPAQRLEKIVVGRPAIDAPIVVQGAHVPVFVVQGLN